MYLNFVDTFTLSFHSLILSSFLFLVSLFPISWLSLSLNPSFPPLSSLWFSLFLVLPLTLQSLLIYLLFFSFHVTGFLPGMIFPFLDWPPAAKHRWYLCLWNFISMFLLQGFHFIHTNSTLFIFISRMTFVICFFFVFLIVQHILFLSLMAYTLVFLLPTSS